MGTANRNDGGPSSRFKRRPLTRGRLYLFSTLIVATVITGVMILFILGNPEVVAVADVMPTPEGSESFFLEEGKYEVWHFASSPPEKIEIWGPGNHRYFRGYADSESFSVFWGSNEYEKIGTFDGDLGKYRVISEEGDNVLIIDLTIEYLLTLVFGILLLVTIAYYIYIVPPKNT